MNNFQPQHEDHDREMRRLAHDLRNSMSVVYGNMQLLEIYLEREGMQREKHIIGKVLLEIKKMNSRVTEAMNEPEENENGHKKPND